MITGWGTALPARVVTNFDLASRLDTSDAWIVERSGIRERHVGGVVSELATRACSAALERAKVDPRDVDLLLLATTTPDEAVPATSSQVHHALGLGGGAMDLNAACSGFVYALIAGYGALATGRKTVLVAGADCLSRLTDEEDRNTAVLFADGAGAVVIEADEQGGSPSDSEWPTRRGSTSLLGYDLGVDGSGHDLLRCPIGGYLTMEGREVFRRAVRMTVESSLAALREAKLSPQDVALFVPHQANLRIIEAAAERLEIPMERTAVVIGHTGNTSAGSIPLALADAAENGRIDPGDVLLLSGVGAGMTWASAVLRWGPLPLRR